MNLTHLETAPSKAAFKIKQMAFKITVLNVHGEKVYHQNFLYLKCLVVNSKFQMFLQNLEYETLMRTNTYSTIFSSQLRKTLEVYVFSCSVVSDSSQSHGLQPTSLLCPWHFQGKKYWTGFSFPPPGNLPNAGIEPSSPFSPCIAGVLLLSHRGSPYIPLFVHWIFLFIMKKNIGSVCHQNTLFVLGSPPQSGIKMVETQQILKRPTRDGKNIWKNYIQKILMNRITMMVWLVTQRHSGV